MERITTPAGMTLENQAIHGRLGKYRPTTDPDRNAWIEYDLREYPPYRISAGWQRVRSADTLEDALSIADEMSK